MFCFLHGPEHRVWFYLPSLAQVGWAVAGIKIITFYHPYEKVRISKKSASFWKQKLLGNMSRPQNSLQPYLQPQK